MSTKLTPRRRKTLPYPSPPGSIDSVSSCSSFSSESSSSFSPVSSPTEPTFTHQFSHEPERHDYSTAEVDGYPATVQFFEAQKVSKPPKPFTRFEEWKLWYSANFGSNLLEPWENILIHLLFLSILALTYVALSRLLSFATLTRLGSRLKFYAIGGGLERSTL
ncbi:uncharacterized protein JCM6883_004643 [Sporobolomyces salmoneus]|uniref:uncharacterized protein n=1 Tax=Sporobolomyces salmoneus TaxID=183962 RepID=UPI00316C2459